MTKTIMLLLTYNCNLRCSYCYEPKTDHKVMSAADAMRYISECVAESGSEYDDFEVQFMGGEPLMEFDTIREVSEWLWSTPMSEKLNNVFVVTNGTLLNDEMMAWFSRNRHRITLGVSFDGTPRMQNHNRSESFASVDLNYFATNWSMQAVKMTVSPYSLRSFSEGVRFLHDKGFGNIMVDLACGAKIGWNSNHLSILKQQLQELMDFYLANPELTPCSTFRLDIFDIGRDSGKVKNCGCGESLTCIDTDGSRYACHLFSPISCDENTVIAGQKIDFTDHDRFQNETCRKCSLGNLCPHCYGMNFMNSNDVAQQDPFICASFKIIYLQNCAFRYRKAVAENDNQTREQIDKLLSGVKI